MNFLPSFHYDWDTSSSSMNDPMVDSGKASDISVSSWPMEPIQWTPFPLLHQLSRQRPVSRAGPGSGFEFWLACVGVLKGPCSLPAAGAQMPVAAPLLTPSRGGRLQQRREPPREALGAISSSPASRLEGSSTAGSARWNCSLHSTKPDGLVRTARGWSWSTLRGAGQPEDRRAKHRHQGSAFKTNHILFPRNKLSEGISNTLTIQSTQVWCQFHSRQSPERLSANVFTTVSDQTSEASFGLGQRIS